MLRAVAAARRAFDTARGLGSATGNGPDTSGAMAAGIRARAGDISQSDRAPGVRGASQLGTVVRQTGGRHVRVLRRPGYDLIDHARTEVDTDDVCAVFEEPFRLGTRPAPRVEDRQVFERAGNQGLQRGTLEQSIEWPIVRRRSPDRCETVIGILRRAAVLSLTCLRRSSHGASLSRPHRWAVWTTAPLSPGHLPSPTRGLAHSPELRSRWSADPERSCPASGASRAPAGGTRARRPARKAPPCGVRRGDRTRRGAVAPSSMAQAGRGRGRSLTAGGRSAR